MQELLTPSNFILAGNSTLSPPPSGSSFQRPSACNWEGYVFTCQPRVNSENSPQDWTYYLDLQYNTINSTAPTGGTYGLDTNVTWGLVSRESASRTQFLTAMQVIDAAPYAFWFETEIDVNSYPVGENTFKYFVVPMSQIGNPWDQTQIKTPLITGLPTASLIDFSTAVIGNKTLFFLAVEQNGDGAFEIQYFTMVNGVFSACALFTSIGSMAELHSIDTSVVLVPKGDGTANQLIALAVCGLDSNGNSVSYNALYNPDNFSASPVVLTPPVFPPTPNVPGITLYRVSLRTGWGSIPVSGGEMVISGLVLVYSLGFNGGDVTFSEGGGGDAYITVIDLSSLQAPIGWTSIKPGPAQSYNIPNGAPMFYPSQISLFPVLIENTVTKNISYTLTVLTNIGFQYTQDLPPPCASFVVQLPSYSLIPTGSVSSSTAENADLSGDDLTAAVSSWLLLGVISGLPPFPDTSADVQVVVEYTKEQSKSSTITSDATTNVSGNTSVGPVSIGGSLGHSLEKINKQTLATTISLKYTFENTQKQGTDGWLLVAQPVYTRNTYAIQTYDGTNADFSLNLLWCSDDALSFGVYSFQLGNPNAISDSQDVWTNAIRHFPVDSNGQPIAFWPASTDLDAWINYKNPSIADSVDPIISLSGFKVEQSVGASEVLNLTSASNLVTTVTNNIDVSTEIKFLQVFKVGYKGSLETRNEVETDVSNSLSISINYSPWGNEVPCQSLMVQPLLYQCKNESAPWVPIPLAGQRPWLLTWQLTSVVKSFIP